MTNWIKYAQWEESQKEIQRFELYKIAVMSIMPQLQLESTVFVKDTLCCFGLEFFFQGTVSF